MDSPGNASPAADASWSPTAFPAPQHPQSAPSSYGRPVPGQPRGHTGIVRGAAFPPANAARNHRLDEDWEDMPPTVESIAAQGQPQDLRYANMGYYDMANDHEYHDRVINNFAGIAPAQAQAQAAPPAPEIYILDGPDQNAASGPAQDFPDEWPHQGPVPDRPANEVLRQLAILYLREPNSQVAVIRMEPNDAHGVRVIITLELTDL